MDKVPLDTFRNGHASLFHFILRSPLGNNFISSIGNQSVNFVQFCCLFLMTTD